MPTTNIMMVITIKGKVFRAVIVKIVPEYCYITRQLL